jgi:hypothetical protein
MGVNLATDFQQFGKIVPGPNSLSTGYRRSGSTVVDLSSLPNSIVPGRVHHIAFTKNDGHHCLFLDGVQICSDYDDVNWSCTSGGIAGLYVGQRGDSTGYFPGKLDDCFMTNDDHFNVAAVDTPILITGEGSDEDTTADNLGINRCTVTFNGGCKLDNAPPTGTKFNATTSIFFPGTTSDYLSVANNSAAKDRFWVAGSLTDDWTVDAWINPSTTAGFPTIMIVASGNETVSGTTDMSTLLNVWSHVAFVKVNADVAIYLNGVKDSVGTVTWTTTDTASPANPVEIGRRATTGIQPFAGYMEQVRLIHSNVFNVDPTAAGGFTAPTSPLAAATLTVPTTLHVPDANTMFSLALQPIPNADWFIDTAPSPNTFTVSGTPYVAGRYGSGCFNFDGTGDNIALPMNNSLEFLEDTKEDVTIHFWVRHTSSPGGTGMQYFYQSNAGFTERFILQHNGSSNVTRFVITTVNGGTQLIDSSVPNTIADDDWHHLAVIGLGTESSVNGKSWQIYMDGSQVAQGYQAIDSLATIDDVMYWGSDRTPGTFFNGQMDAIQIVRSNIFGVPVSVSGDTFDASALTLMNTAPVLGATSSDIVLTSVYATTTGAAPDTVKDYIDLEDISPTIVLNTDLTVEATRDGGTTWTTGVLAQTGQATAGRRLVCAEIDVSAQPDPGADNATVGYRLSTFNDIRMRFHANTRVWG